MTVIEQTVNKILEQYPTPISVDELKQLFVELAKVKESTNEGVG